MKSGYCVKCVAKFGPENSQSKTICDHDDVRPMSMDHCGRFDASSILSVHIAGSFERQTLFIEAMRPEFEEESYNLMRM